MKNIALNAYLKAQQISSQLQFKDQQPLTFKDSLSHMANYPFCTLGVLTAQSDQNTFRGVAVVVDDNYLLTCASNCYSLQNKKYSNITFTINSNRKHGWDTYKISKVFVPLQYQLSKQNETKQYNYALLYIAGNPNLRDKYGSSKIFQFKQDAKFILKCLVNQNDGLKMMAEYVLRNNTIYLSKKAPTTKQMQFQSKVNDLIQLLKDHIRSILTMFSPAMFTQLGQWTKTERGELILNNIKQQRLDLSCFATMQKKPIRKITMNKCRINHRETFEQLPFSAVMDLNITNYKINQIGLDFLKMKKFENLKILKLKSINIGIVGCKCIVDAAFHNLRMLNLNNSQVGSKGCQQLSLANWPFLQYLQLNNCNIGVRGLASITLANFKNLLHLQMSYNIFGNAETVDDFLERTAFPRIKSLNLCYNQWRGLSLEFLKSNNWQQVKTLKLADNPIGSKGCKMIKQAGLTLEHLNVQKCKIDAVGMKWLCKMNMNNLISFEIRGNKIGHKGYFYISTTNLSNIIKHDINCSDTTMNGIKLLLKVDWTTSALNELLSYVSYMKINRYVSQSLKAQFMARK